MCDAQQVVTTALGVGAALLLPKLLGNNDNSQQQSGMPAPQLAVPPPQPAAAQGAQNPTYDTFMTANKRNEQAGYGGTPNSTFLTGAQGVDPLSLNLGVNTLLGQ